MTAAPFLMPALASSPGLAAASPCGFEAKGIGAELLDAERDALLVDIDIEHLDLDGIAFLEVLDDLFAGLVPIEVGEMDHAVDLPVEADE